MKITVNLSDANFKTARAAVSYLNRNTVSGISHQPITDAQHMATHGESGKFPGGFYETAVVENHYEYRVDIEDEAIQNLTTGVLKVLLMVWPLYVQCMALKQMAMSIMEGFAEKVRIAFADYIDTYTKSDICNENTNSGEGITMHHADAELHLEDEPSEVDQIGCTAGCNQWRLPRICAYLRSYHRHSGRSP